MKASEMSNEELADFIQWFGAPVGSLALDEAITRLRTMIPVPQVQIVTSNSETDPPYSVRVNGVEIEGTASYAYAASIRELIQRALTPNTKEKT